MKGRITISGLQISVQVESADPQLEAAVQKLLANEMEQIEAVVAESVAGHVRHLLPWIKTRVMSGEEEE